MDWLNDNSGVIQAISTGVLVLITAVYVYLTASANRLASDGIKEGRRVYEMDLRTRRGANVSLAPSRGGGMSLRARGPSRASHLSLHLEIEGQQVGPPRTGAFPDLVNLTATPSRFNFL